jgi:hypothetical protein
MTRHGLDSVGAARELLTKLGAPPRLLQHGVLVGEAADVLLDCLQRMRVPVDAHYVRLGAVLHDAGKILHAEELAQSGSAHEPAGEQLLLGQGVAPSVARCCVSHARWAEEGVSFEELLVALADKLWKGKREPALEKQVIAVAGTKLGRDFWDLFVELDTCFESIASDGTERLARSEV